MPLGYNSFHAKKLTLKTASDFENINIIERQTIWAEFGKKKKQKKLNYFKKEISWLMKQKTVINLLK